MNRHQHKYTIKELYPVSGFSKQAHKKFMDRQHLLEEQDFLVLNTVLEIRKIHPNMGLKKIYSLINPDWIGRDRFVNIGMLYDLGIKIRKSFHRTTFSSKCYWFVNLTVDLPIIGINQVWTSDITYFRVGDRFYYITFIIDVYSRRILGAIAYETLEAEGSCKALNQAIMARKGHDLNGLIHHSDRGVQYTSNAYLDILKRNSIAVSMCDNVYENTHIERVNGIMKHEYLDHLKISDLNELRRGLRNAVSLYNNERPHWNLELKTPVQYEKELEDISKNDRKIMRLFSEKKEIYVQQSFFN